MNSRGTPGNLRPRPPWKKGESGNPRGRPPAPWREWLASQEPEFREALARMANDKRLRPETRGRFMQWFLDHTHGLPKQPVEQLQPTVLIVSVDRGAFYDFVRGGCRVMVFDSPDRWVAKKDENGDDVRPILVVDENGKPIPAAQLRRELNGGGTRRRDG